MSLFFALLLAGSVAQMAPLPPESPSSGTSGEQPAIRAVIEKFRTAIIARDGATLNALQLNDHITFVGVADAATLARTRLKRPAATGVDTGSYGNFVRDIVTATVSSEEKFSNVAIRSDGAIADVYFDYTFEEDHVVTNWGHESWNLVRTPDGWKISAIVYSITLPAASSGT